MKITRLTLQNFRNLDALTLTPGPGVNILYGDNAQGKTNLVESIWLLTGARSFRGCKDSELPRIGSEGARSFVEARFWSQGREQQVRLDFAPKKQAAVNEIALPTPGRLAGTLYVSVFSPSHLSLVKEGPQERRDFIDTTICQLKPQYGRVLTDYNRVLTQRNSLLKDLPYNAYLTDTLDIWDNHLVRLNALMVRTRSTYLRRLGTLAAQVYAGIAEGREELTLRYVSRAAPDPWSEDLEGAIAAQLRAARQEDIRAGATTIGAHRDDIAIEISGLSARSYGSQGQQRSVVLALKLAECELIRQVSGEEPVVLLDDVMSELDRHRREYLLNSMGDRQIFITCCDRGLFDGVRDARIFAIQGGQVLERQRIDQSPATSPEQTGAPIEMEE